MFSEKVEKIVENLTTDEKLGLFVGLDGWNFASINGHTPIRTSDGPSGLRKIESDGKKKYTVKSTAFPTAEALASIFDDETVEKTASAIARETKENGVDVLLAPGTNIKRNPLGGRNFEYFSEDPLLAGRSAAAYINGLENNGVGSSLKHYALNSREMTRRTYDAVVDERALRDIYLRPFEYALKTSSPLTVMGAYNKAENKNLCENKRFLEDLLRKEFGFDGIVISDWGAVSSISESVKNGLNVEMPYPPDSFKKLKKAVNCGELDMETVDLRAKQIISALLKVEEYRNVPVDTSINVAEIAYEAAAKSIVLLDNKNNLLPLDKKVKIAVIGEFAEKPLVGGAGSSLVNPITVVSPLDAIKDMGVELVYAQGFDAAKHSTDKSLVSEAINAARSADVVIFFGGLFVGSDGEGGDRGDMCLPEIQNRLIEEIACVNANTVVVLETGAPVEMPWADMVSAIILGHLSGSYGGKAIAGVIFGDVNPSGRLSETYPVHYEDVPSYKYFLDDAHICQYRESIFVGYRYYSTANVKPLFAFGHGLSYSNFEYSDAVEDGGKITVKVTNTSAVDGDEVVQLYVAPPDGKIIRPVIELRDYKRVSIPAGQTVSVSFDITEDWFTFYNVKSGKRETEGGTFTVMLGSASDNIKSTVSVKVESTLTDTESYIATAPTYLTLQSAIKPLTVPKQEFEALVGRPVPEYKPDGKVTLDTELFELPDSFWPNLLKSMIVNKITKNIKDAAKKEKRIMELNETPLRSISVNGKRYFRTGASRLKVYLAGGFVTRRITKSVITKIKNFLFNE